MPWWMIHSPPRYISTGTIANIVQSLRLPDGNIKVLVEGVERAKALQILEEGQYMKAVLQPTAPAKPAPGNTETLVNKITSLFEQYVKLSQNLNYDTMAAAVRVEDIDRLADTVAANLAVTIEEKQELLEIFNPVDRLHRLCDISGCRDREIERGSFHQLAGQASDGKGPERVLPE